MLFLRALLLTIPRFIVLLGLLLALENFDVSPFPIWTLTVTAYLIHFFVTYFFAIWTFGKRVPQWSHALTVVLTFVIFGTSLEAGVFLISQKGDVSDLWRNYHWQSLYIIFVYAIAIFLAMYRVRHKRVREALPEGMEG